MADVGYDTDFGSHFLDSMLEVEMREEDGEVDISKSEETSGGVLLPPIPTFDLQSETLTYKPPEPDPKPMPVPSAVSVLKPGSLLRTYPGPSPAVRPSAPAVHVPTLLSSPATLIRNSTPTTLKNVTATLLKSTPATVVRAPGPGIKPAQTLLKNSYHPAVERVLATKFLRQVFKREYSQNVFTEKDSTDKTNLEKEELEYYRNCFKDLANVRYCRLHCTICDKHLGCGSDVDKKYMVHKMLKVLTCKQCSQFYGDGNFPCDSVDNCEVYCRWCGQGGALVCCSFCPRVFCRTCVRRNYGPTFLKSIQKASDWACFCCAQKPLWPHRAVCRALVEYLRLRKTDPKLSQKDTTTCCSDPKRKNANVKPGKGQGVKEVPGPQVAQLDVNRKVMLPLKTVLGGDQSVLKKTARTKANGPRPGFPETGTLLSHDVKINVPPSLVVGNSLFRNLVLGSGKNAFAQYIESPVLHGETLITPPGSRMSVQPRKIAPRLTPSSTQPSSAFRNVSVKVLPSNQAANMDLSKVPSVTIPHNIGQNTILRISIPEANRFQHVRLVSTDTCCRPGGKKEFPVSGGAVSRNGHVGVVQQSLDEAFRMSKMVQDQLAEVRDRVTGPGTRPEEEVSALSSAVSQLRGIYKKAADVFRNLDETLLENYDDWQRRKYGTAKVVVELSDDVRAKVRGPGLSKVGDTVKHPDLEILESMMKAGTRRGQGDGDEAKKAATKSRKVPVKRKKVVKRRVVKRPKETPQEGTEPGPVSQTEGPTPEPGTTAG